MDFDLALPTSVVFGRGRLAELGARTSAYGRSVVVVCGREAMRRNQILTAAVSSLESAGLTVTVMDVVSPDPRADEVDAVVEVALRQRIEVVVGLGGGSAVDAAKAAGIGMRHGKVGPLVGRTLEAGVAPVPVVAVPTTAGSGAEVTRGAIVTDTERRLKSGIRGPDVAPVLAVVDPDLLASVPRAVALESGFDAFAHAVEGYLARRSTPITRAWSEVALEILLRRLPQISRAEPPGGTSELRDRHDEMALAALLGGLNVAAASTCLPHRLQQAMGAVPRVRISHGAGLAVLYPAWVRQTASVVPAACAALAARVGQDSLESVVEGLLAQVAPRRTLSQAGFTQADLDVLVAGVTGNTDNDPTPDIEPALLHRLLAESL